MQKLWLPVLAFLLPLAICAQKNFHVGGKVIDSNSRQSLQGASVFCQNTTIGTVTDSSGNFHMTLSNGGYDLVVSFTGYETQSIRINNVTPDISNLILELKPKEKSLEEVSIVASNEVKDGWTKYGQFFFDNFIGRTLNSKLCSIQNPETLHFFFSKKKNRLKVIAKDEMIIVNKALGYRIRYQLDSFIYEYSGDKTLYTGYPFFEEMQSTADSLDGWRYNRAMAYKGSLLQFMRAYHDSTLNKAGFKLEIINDNTDKASPIYNPYDTSMFSIIENNKAELFFPGKLRVVYSKEKPETAYLQANRMPLQTPIQISILDLNESIIIEENGYYFDQKDILTLGYWGWEKMGDFLPYDYYP